ncbi:MAG: 3'-5' exonuclease [Myxococcota bacterium]
MRFWRGIWRTYRLARERKRVGAKAHQFQAYLKHYEPLDDRTPLSELRFLVLDTEATGLDVAHDRMLSLAAVVVHHQAICAAQGLELTVRHDSVGPKAAPIHGMVTGDLVDGVNEPKALEAFLELLGNSVLVAHHASFDVGLLNAALRRHAGPELQNDVLDTERLARRIELGSMAHEPTSLRFSLDALAERYALETDARHTAAGDSLMTAELLLVLLARAHKAGMRTLGQLV